MNVPLFQISNADENEIALYNSIKKISASSNIPSWKKVTKSYSDFATSSTTNAIVIYTLKAKEVVHAVMAKTSTNFTGGSISAYTISVGITGSVAKYMTAFDVRQAVGNTVISPAVSLAPVLESYVSGIQIKATSTSTSANLSAATQGSIDFWILTSILP